MIFAKLEYNWKDIYQIARTSRYCFGSVTQKLLMTVLQIYSLIWLADT